jgi:hypothetical protein
MLPAEEYSYLKRKYEAEKAVKLQAAKGKQQKSYGYGAAAFASAIHGMPPSATQRLPPRKDSYFRMKPSKSTQPQPKYLNKKKCAQVAIAIRQSPAVYKGPANAEKAEYMKKLLPKPDYSNPRLRKNYAYRPQGLSGKAGEVLGVTNKRIYANKPVPVDNKKTAKKAVKKAVKYAPKPKKAYRPAKNSTGCVVM